MGASNLTQRSCCGGGKKTGANRVGTISAKTTPQIAMARTNLRSVPSLIGSGGMTKIKYLGLNIARNTYGVPGTNRAYTFSAKKPEQLVANEDVEFFLAMAEHGKPLFEVVDEEEEEATDKVAATEDAPEKSNAAVASEGFAYNISDADAAATQAARDKAEEYGLDYTQIEGTGVNGRVTIEDVETAFGKVEYEATDAAEEYAKSVMLDLREVATRNPGVRIGKPLAESYYKDRLARISAVDATGGFETQSNSDNLSAAKDAAETAADNLSGDSK